MWLYDGKCFILATISNRTDWIYAFSKTNLFCLNQPLLNQNKNKCKGNVAESFYNIGINRISSAWNIYKIYWLPSYTKVYAFRQQQSISPNSLHEPTSLQYIFASLSNNKSVVASIIGY